MARFQEEGGRKEKRDYNKSDRPSRSASSGDRDRRSRADPRDFRRTAESSPRRFDRDNNYSRSPSRGSRDSGARDEWKETFKAICAECGKSCEVPFRPTNSKPIYCSDCFRKIERAEKKGLGKADAAASANLEEMKEKLDEIERKLDKVLEALGFD